MHDVARAVALLQVLRTANALHRAIIDDGDAAAHSVGLVHGVCRQNHCAVRGQRRGDHAPEQASGKGVQPGGRFVEEHQLRAREERDCNGKFPLHATAVGLGDLSERKLRHGHDACDIVLPVAAAVAVPKTELEVQMKMLLAGEGTDQRVVLLAHTLADDLAGDVDGGRVRPGKIPKRNGTARRVKLELQHAHCAGLSGAVGAQQPEAFPGVYTERYPLHGNLVALVFHPDVVGGDAAVRTSRGTLTLTVETAHLRDNVNIVEHVHGDAVVRGLVLVTNSTSVHPNGNKCDRGNLVEPDHDERDSA
eukprot:PhM_4_TR11637/c0_g1_i4/m.40314